MKILLVHNTYQQAGGEDVVFEQERQLLERNGHQVLTYVRSNHELDAQSAAKRLAMVKNIVSADDSAAAIRNILRSERPEIVHVHNTFLMISPSIFAVCSEEQVPVLQTLHNYRMSCPAGSFYRDGQVCEECSQHSLFRSIQHGCYRDSRLSTAAVALMLQVHRMKRTWQDSVSGYLALTEFARDKFVENGIPPEKIHVKPNFVYPDPGERSAPGNFALFAGRLTEEKGLPTLLAAWGRLEKHIPLEIVGDGPLRPELEAQAEQMGLQQVKFRGRLNVNETRARMKQAALLIVPSVWYEAFSLNIAEAFACGTPVLCSRLGAMRENVADQRTGLHFTAGDAADLAEKVEWAWGHSREMAAMGREARREYERRYTPERNYSLLMKIYRQTVNSHA
jgi:glycosyltransferase involved in cell wall biosynthesis